MNVFSAMDRLLKRPDEALAAHPLVLLTGSVACYVVYGIVAGCFQGGWTVGLAVLKVPMIIVGSIALCTPSLYVMTALAGRDYAPRMFASVVAGLCGIAGLILIALMPVVWLFSVSTLSLEFVVWLHLLVWIVAIAFGWRFLARTAPGARTTIAAWTFILLLVSLQMTTYVRPVLWRDANQPLFAQKKMAFFTHLGHVVDWKPPLEVANDVKPPATPRR